MYSHQIQSELCLDLKVIQCLNSLLIVCIVNQIDICVVQVYLHDTLLVQYTINIQSKSFFPGVP